MHFIGWTCKFHYMCKETLKSSFFVTERCCTIIVNFTEKKQVICFKCLGPGINMPQSEPTFSFLMMILSIRIWRIWFGVNSYKTMDNALNWYFNLSTYITCFMTLSSGKILQAKKKSVSPILLLLVKHLFRIWNRSSVFVLI